MIVEAKSSRLKHFFRFRRIDMRRRFISLLILSSVIYFLQRYYTFSLRFFNRVFPPSRMDCSWNGREHDFGIVPVTSKPLKFGILILFDKRMAQTKMAKLSVKNKRFYAERHGYELIVVSGEEIDPSRPAAWSKFKALAEHLHRFDYILFVDVDALIMNFDIRLQDLVNPSKDIFITEDWNGLNTGVFVVRNTPWGHWFLKEAWGEKGSEQEYMSHHEKSRSGIKYPFEYEQRAVHYIYQTSMWRERNLPRYHPGASAPGQDGSPWEHSLILPQCSLNSYMLHPEPFSWLFGSSERYVGAQWVPGDFIVHMAGHKGYNKQSIFEHCYKVAKTSNAVINGQNSYRLG